MEEIARQSQYRKLFTKAVAGLADVKDFILTLSAQKIAIAICTSAAIAVTGTVLMNLKHIKIIDAGKTMEVSTFSSSPAEILKNNNVKYIFK